MARVAVRPATSADARAVACTWVESWRAGYAHVFPAERLAALSLDEREAWTRRFLERPEGGALLVGELGGSVAGFASLGAARDPDSGTATGEVYAIYVDPPRWETGVGRALMAAALELLGRRGFSEALLWVLEDNPRARRFYEAGGWRLDGARREGEHLGIATEEVRYRIDLPR